MYWANKERNNMDNPTNIQCAPIYNNAYGYPEGAQHQIFDDEQKCLQGTVGDTLTSNQNTSAIYSPLVMTSPGCATSLSVQSNGRVVLTDVASGKQHWATNNTATGSAPYRLTMQNDGNLVLSDSRSTQLWSSNTANVGCAPYKLKLRDVLKLTVVDCNSEPIWSANVL
jgi:hypothetical protein